MSPEPEETFPVRPPEKRSYNQNIVVWVKQSGLQSDVQKILRQARKLPEKTNNFYKVTTKNSVLSEYYCFFSFKSLSFNFTFYFTSFDYVEKFYVIVECIKKILQWGIAFKIHPKLVQQITVNFVDPLKIYCKSGFHSTTNDVQFGRIFRSLIECVQPIQNLIRPNFWNNFYTIYWIPLKKIENCYFKLAIVWSSFIWGLNDDFQWLILTMNQLTT